MEQPRASESLDGCAAKGSIVIGLVKIIDRKGWRAGLEARLPPETARLLRERLLSSEWIPQAQLDPLYDAVLALHGVDACRAIAREGAMDTQIPLLQSLASGFLRLFGATPATIYTRVPETMKLVARGITAQWTSLGPSSGQMRITQVARRNVSMGYFHATAGGLEVPLVMVRTRGTVAAPAIVPDGKHNAADYHIEWSR